MKHASVIMRSVQTLNTHTHVLPWNESLHWHLPCCNASRTKIIQGWTPKRAAVVVLSLREDGVRETRSWIDFIAGNKGCTQSLSCSGAVGAVIKSWLVERCRHKHNKKIKKVFPTRVAWFHFPPPSFFLALKELGMFKWQIPPWALRFLKSHCGILCSTFEWLSKMFVTL